MQRRTLLTGALGLGALAACSTTPQALGSVETPALRRIAVGSCMDQTKPQPIWDTVLASRPDLFVFGGDNVYASERPWSLARLQAAYAQQAAVPGFARLRHIVPHLAIWDDHDYGSNDAGFEFAHKQASKAAFLEFWKTPADDPRRSRDGLHHAQMFGPPQQRVQVILLDTRWARSPLKASDHPGAPGKERYMPDGDPAKTMLGDAQWRWLEAQLREPAQLRFLVSGIQVVVDGHGWERWGNLPLERERLYRLIQQTGARGVVFLSGDRHIGALYREASGLTYPLFELTSSGITHPWREAAEAGPNRLGALFTEQHFGSIDIDWQAQSLRLALRGLDGAPQRSHTVLFRELSPI